MRDYYILDDDRGLTAPSPKEILGEWCYEQYKGGAVSKIKITSTASTYMMHRPGEVIRQALTIRNDGRVALTSFEGVGIKFNALDSRNFDYDPAVTGDVIYGIRTFFESKHESQDVMDAGEWEIVIIDEDGNRFKQAGSMGFDEDLATLSHFIRNKLDMKLFLFDGEE